MARGDDDELQTVNDWANVPSFANEDEEAEFWATHGLGGAALESLGTFDDDALPTPRQRRHRFWHRIAPLSAANGATSTPTEKPVVEDQYARLGRLYRENAA
jgi:hypothetical protein